MFKRSALKKRAKEVLSLNYWNIFVAILLTTAISSAASGIITLFTGGSIVPRAAVGMGILGALRLTAGALSLAVTALLIAPLQVGLNKYVLELSNAQQSNLDQLLYAFRTNYIGIATALFVKILIVDLLMLIPAVALTIIFGATLSLQSSTLLFALLPLFYIAMIPALIKTYDFYLVEYILTEKPELTWREALSESKALMRGNRFAVFKLNLSFFGWILLGILSLGVGVLFVMPYIQATDAELYRELTGKTIISDGFESV